jgi:hypothetical protein
VALVHLIDIDHGYLVLYEQDESPRFNRHVLTLRTSVRKRSTSPFFLFIPARSYHNSAFIHWCGDASNQPADG